MKTGLLSILILYFGFTLAEIPLSQKIVLLPLTQNAKLQLKAAVKAPQFEATKKAIHSATNKRVLRPLKIAEASIINKTIDDIGQWQTVNGQDVWRLQITAEEALHLNLGFKNVHFPETAVLFISNTRSGEILKQYSAADNKPHGELWTPLLDAKDLTLEVNLGTLERNSLQLELAQAGQGIKTVYPAEYSAISGECNIDVTCPEGDEWQDEISAVARYIITDTSGTFLCSGTLLNNTRQDMAPLFITAAHCLVSDTTAASMVFYWNYETSVCNGEPDGALTQEQNGARLISRWDDLDNGSDFALVMLDRIPDPAFDVFFAGWDNRDQSYTGVRTIHHPQGEEKRISVDNDSLTITAYDSEITDVNAAHFRVGEWDKGTTEGGSSGSGLWNLNHRLVGTLSGGSASCDTPAEADWFGRFARHWSGNNYLTNQVAPYLDPAISTVSTINGKYNCAAPSVAITTSNTTPAVSEQISFTSVVTGDSGGYSYEWDFDNNGSIDSIEANPIHTYNTTANNIVTLVVRDSEQCSVITTHHILVADRAENFLGDGQIPNGFSKATTAEGSWIIDDGRVSEGLFSLKSQIVNGNNNSSIELTGTYEAGRISFDRSVSSEEDSDCLKFYIDDVEQFSISGEQDWTNVSFAIAEGDHTFRWTFEKDEAVSKGQDAAWIDNLEISVNPPPPPPPSEGGGGSLGLFLLGLLLIYKTRNCFRCY